MSFFKDFPLGEFEFNGTRYQIQNFTHSVVNDPSLVFNSAFLQNYYVRPGMRPDIVADELYDDVNDWWIIFVINGISYNEWPLDDSELNEWVDTVYSEREQNLVQEFVDDDGNNTPQLIPLGFSVDGVELTHQSGYLVNRTGYTKTDAISLGARWGGTSNTLYTTLRDKNESKRFLKVIKPEYLTDFKKDFKDRILGRVFV